MFKGVALIDGYDVCRALPDVQYDPGRPPAGVEGEDCRRGEE